MNTRRTLRMIWKINAPIILVAGLGVCTMLGTAQPALSAADWNFAGTTWSTSRRGYLPSGSLEHLLQFGYAIPHGFGLFCACLFSRHFWKEISAVRKYLFVNTHD